MKNLLAILLAFPLVLGAASCHKMEHDEHATDNEMKTLMHAMHGTMDALQKTGDPDHDFAAMMKLHHQGAIDMATLELSKGDDATIRGMAQTIKDAQTAEIRMLDSFMAAHTPVSSAAGASYASAEKAAMDKMATDTDAVASNGDTDHDFTHLMIVHHQSAIDMAKAELQYGAVQQMKDMAQQIITDQEKETAEFRTWLAAGND